ncbi:hypothetical protein EPA93_13875 [Ktedonosporobacter rubrisoli]|uniref:Pyrrolo-quinoline quinone repeat domain-containing protein n=1 Tax=Ktedonosporobacter rubrisoli TaxID=2509675 RepID=A0A4P6JPM0_KTERU|nr:PQQ-binding-like beta-propeller repeat protein [Ktedonosporobacter rubrisoli]QBD77032.1 hypothetical protein EPA93_13875 [Ktedonosporobacter rubrisoli]
MGSSISKAIKRGYTRRLVLPSLLVLCCVLLFFGTYLYLETISPYNPLCALAAPTPPSLLKVSTIEGNIYIQPAHLAARTANGKVLWEKPGLDAWALTAQDGILYVQSNRLAAVRISDGQTLWETAKDTVVTYRPVETRAPLVVNGTVYGQYDRYFVALRASDGKLLWKTPSDQAFMRLQAADREHVYITTFDGRSADDIPTITLRLLCLRAQDGTVQWTREQKIPSIAYDKYKITQIIPTPDALLVQANNSFWALRAQSGQEVWHFSVHLPQESDEGYAVTVQDDLVFLSTGSTLYALHINDGSQLWSFHAPETPTNTNTLLADDDHVYAQLNALYAFQADTGKVIWKQTLNHPRYILLANGILYLMQVHPFLSAIRAGDGQPLWQIESNTLPTSIATRLVAADNTNVYIASSGYDRCYHNAHSSIYAFRASDGYQIWSYRAAR